MSERRFAILIGNSQFPDEPKLTTLRAPANDVDGMNEVLTSKDLGGFTDITVLKNESSHEARRKILSVLKKARKDDFVLIYYSGHGKLDPTGRLHLATKDTTVDELEATSIPITNIRDYVENTNCNQVALVLDCCFSGAAGGVFARGTVDDQLQIVSRGRGMYIMTASTEIQIAQERPTDKYGLFTKNVIEGIATGNADLNGDGVVTMDELYDYVHRRMREEGFQEPTKCAFDVRGELVIARTRKSSEETESERLSRSLIELYRKRIISRSILTETLDSLDNTTESDPRRLLVNELVQDRLSADEFIEAWTKSLASKSSSGNPSVVIADPSTGVVPDPSEPMNVTSKPSLHSKVEASAPSITPVNAETTRVEVQGKGSSAQTGTSNVKVADKPPALVVKSEGTKLINETATVKQIDQIQRPTYAVRKKVWPSVLLFAIFTLANRMNIENVAAPDWHWQNQLKKAFGLSTSVEDRSPASAVSKLNTQKFNLPPGQKLFPYSGSALDPLKVPSSDKSASILGQKLSPYNASAVDSLKVPSSDKSTLTSILTPEELQKLGISSSRNNGPAINGLKLPSSSEDNISSISSLGRVKPKPSLTVTRLEANQGTLLSKTPLGTASATVMVAIVSKGDIVTQLEESGPSIKVRTSSGIEGWALSSEFAAIH